MPGDCPNPYGCQWTIGYLWHWMNWLARLDVILLALLLAYTFAVAIHSIRLLRTARRAQGTDRPTRTKVRAELNIEAGNLKSIAFIAPYLGLIGTCFGTLSVFRGFDMEKHAALLMLTSRVAASLVTAPVGMMVALPATCFYNYLVTRLDLLEDELPAPRHRFTKRFSAIPAFALIAAPVLAILVVAYMTFASFHPPRGFAIKLPSSGCESDVADRLIVLNVASGGRIFLDAERQDWNTLESRLVEAYSTRVRRTLCISADDDVPFSDSGRRD